MISSRHHIYANGYHIGWVGLTGKPAAKDGWPVAVVRKLGGVPYVKSNIPQSMMVSAIGIDQNHG